MPGDDLDPFEIKGNLSVIANSDPLEFGNGSIDVDGDINLNGTIGENTIGNGINIRDTKSIVFKDQTEPATPSTDNVILFNNSDRLQAKNDSGSSSRLFLESDIPLTTKGDIFTRNSSNITRLPLGSNSQALTVNTSTATGLEWNNVGIRAIIIISDVKSQGSNGGTFNDDSWITRTLNTLSGNGNTYVTLSNNRFTLDPGKYYIEVHAPSYKVEENQARLFNDTDNNVELLGQSAYAKEYSTSVIKGYLDFSSSKQFRIQHRCDKRNNGDGFGRACGFTNEVYTKVTLILLEEN